MNIKVQIVIFVFFMVLCFGAFTFLAQTQYIPRNAMNLSEEFIELMWNGSYREGYIVALEEGTNWSNFSEFRSTWIECFSEDYRENNNYTIYSDEVLQSGHLHPFQSLGNYYKRVLLNRKPAQSKNISIQYFIKDSTGQIHSLRLHLQLENKHWKILYFEKMAG